MVIVALPAAEEVSDAPSDTGSEVDALKKEFGDDKVDFDHLKVSLESIAGGFGWLDFAGRKLT